MLLNIIVRLFHKDCGLIPINKHSHIYTTIASVIGVENGAIRHVLWAIMMPDSSINMDFILVRELKAALGVSWFEFMDICIQ